jgi:hypothetical protein
MHILSVQSFVLPSSLGPRRIRPGEVAVGLGLGGPTLTTRAAPRRAVAAVLIAFTATWTPELPLAEAPPSAASPISALLLTLLDDADGARGLFGPCCLCSWVDVSQ